MVNGWVKYQGSYYYMNASGIPVVNDWVEYNGTWYHLNGSGVCDKTYKPASVEDRWLGTWVADTGETFTIYSVSDSGLKLTWTKILEQGWGTYDYELEFDNAEKTVASEIREPGQLLWEYTFTLGDGYITVESRYPDRIYYKAA